MNAQQVVLLCGIALLVVFLASFVAAFLSLFRPWLQCFLSGAAVPLYQIVGMRLRGSPVKMICEQRIKASYVGEDLTVEQLERAYLQGADICRAVDAICLAKQTDTQVRWDDLIATDLSSKG